MGGLLDGDDDGVVLEAIRRPQALHRVRRHVHDALNALDESDEARLGTAEVTNGKPRDPRRRQAGRIELGVDIGGELLRIKRLALETIGLVAIVGL